MGKGSGFGARLTSRALVARRCGFELYHPATSCAEVEGIIRRSAAASLSEVEREAWAGLLPATWAVNFREGWADAEQASHRG